MTEWKAQLGSGKFAMQFETDDYNKYKELEKYVQGLLDVKPDNVFDALTAALVSFSKQSKPQKAKGGSENSV